MRNIKITIAYNGTGFLGWQIQKPRQRTVQGEIEKALKKIFKKKTKLIGSGRTDRGTHALGQVANFQTSSRMSPLQIQKALNTLLTDDIVIIKVESVSAQFHAQFSAHSKIYRYSLYTKKVRPILERPLIYHHPYPLHLPLMQKEAQCLLGEHDFRSFMAADHAQRHQLSLKGKKDTTRFISRLEIKKKGALITIDIEANGFLYKMVRNIVGTLLEVGTGKILPGRLKEILQAKDRSLAAETAPAQGLCLLKVIYLN